MVTATTTSPANDNSERLPVAGLLALAMTGFICILTETLPAGLLPQMSRGLNVSPSLAGQTVTAYAVGSLVAVIPLTIVTSTWRRRKVLMLTIFGFLVFNTVTAISSDFALTLVARLFAGVSAGLAWSLLGGYARRMVSIHQQGKAMTIAMVGTPIALSFGVPLGTWFGAAVGWRAAFWIMSLLTLMLIVWVLTKVPDFPGQKKDERRSLLRVLTTPGVRPVLAVVIAWMLAHNILYTYIAPFLEGAGLKGRVDIVLLVFGLAALGGIWVTGKFVDHALRAHVLISLAAFALTSLLLAIVPTSQVMIYNGVVVWGLTFGGAATLLQTALADTAGDGADVAQSINVVAWNGAIAGGGIMGGILLDGYGASSFPSVLIVLVAAALAITWFARTHGFPPGHRLSKERVLGH
ncbi:MFS transporter [Rhizobium sp. 16-449-1b]|uniref:MFS transporter n=1 Tax=Rhizobium sp. 16-449-1b TaxID=2819989 RepID=UPI001ADBC831|nr:MFS transporter [Rhizobium sp. 16-449-1b]MBO9198591.1 MFS transporter [Rhizobium sp. 16-449-1b]